MLNKGPFENRKEERVKDSKHGERLTGKGSFQTDVKSLWKIVQSKQSDPIEAESQRRGYKIGRERIERFWSKGTRYSEEVWIWRATTQAG